MSEGYSLYEVLDYDLGLPFDDLAALQAQAQRISLERHKAEVAGVAVALSSLFDKKVLRAFNAAIDRVVTSIGPARELTREEKIQKTMRELNKLKRIPGFGDGGLDDAPPWERGET